MITFSCPSCRRIGQATDDLAGKMVTCPGCAQLMLVPHFVLTNQHVQEPAPAAGDEAADGLIRFFCPGCQQKLKVPASAAQGTTNCTHCGTRVDVTTALRQGLPPLAIPGSQSQLAYLPDIIAEEAAHYYYIKNNQRHGPVTAQVLRQMAAAGQLEPKDWVWKPGFAHWKHAGRAKGLFPRALPAMPPPPPRHRRPSPSPEASPALLPTQRPSAISPAAEPAPPPVPDFLGRCMALTEGDDAEQALAELDATIRQEPHNAQALAARGLIWAKSKGNYNRGLADLSAAIRFAPRETALYDLRAILYHELGDLRRAQADEKKAAKLRARAPKT